MEQKYCLDCGKEIKGFGIRCKSCCQKGKLNHRFGKIMSQEFKDNISKKNSGIKKSKEWINKIVEARKGWKHSEETKKIIAEKVKGNKNMLGKHHSKETIEKFKIISPKYDYGKVQRKYLKNRRIQESHLNWCIRNQINRIPDGCIIHHIDGNLENNESENLQLMTNDFHTKLHKTYNQLLRQEKCL